MPSLHKDPNYIKGKGAIARGIGKEMVQLLNIICLGYMYNFLLSYYSIININIIKV